MQPQATAHGSHGSHNSALPRGAVPGAAALVCFSLVAVIAARIMHWQATPLPAASPVTVLHLSFRDRPSGAVEVRDADHDEALVHVIAPGTNGFARGVLRGLARERRAEGVGAAPPFTLTRWSDGRLTLEDPQTKRQLSLEVFGPSNAQPFADLFTVAPATELQGSTP
jgi:putative photosynthetic complex assembly protein